jgi:hypothetical protein
MNMISKATALALAVLLAFGAGVSAPIGDAQARGYTKAQSAKHARHHRANHRVHRKARSAKHASHRAHRKARNATTQRRTASKSRHAHRGTRKHSRSAASYRHHRMNLGATATIHSRRAHTPRTSSRGGGGVSWSASSGCLNSTLRGVVHQVAARFGSLRVNSTCRSRASNRRAGGAGHSHHLTGNAVDFRVFGNVSAVASYLRSNGSIGGYKHYGGGLFHIDTGPRRSW